MKIFFRICQSRGEKPLFELFREINWSLLGTLAVVSALVAWAGDIIGMKLGKKRVTFLKLRPKYTSRINLRDHGHRYRALHPPCYKRGIGTCKNSPFQHELRPEPDHQPDGRTAAEQGQPPEHGSGTFQKQGRCHRKAEELNSLEQRLAAGTKSLREARAELERMTAIIASTEEEQKALPKRRPRLNRRRKDSSRPWHRSKTRPNASKQTYSA